MFAHFYYFANLCFSKVIDNFISGQAANAQNFYGLIDWILTGLLLMNENNNNNNNKIHSEHMVHIFCRFLRHTSAYNGVRLYEKYIT